MRIGVLTTGRQDWGILRSTCALLRDGDFDLRLLVGGMHCARRFGETRALIEAEGFAPAEVMDWIGEGEPPAAAQAGRALEMVGAALARQRPDALVLVGDRFETAAAAIAATLALVPLVHLHGGEETEGAFDNALRHAVTKLAHLHLVSHPEYKRRVEALGEDPATVHVVGAPGLDNLWRADLAARDELERVLGLALAPPVVVVTLHPTTWGGDPSAEAEALAAAMRAVEATYVVTMPNVDPGNREVRAVLERLRGAPRVALVEALGERRYFGLLRLADALLGNSSSAILEAPALGLPSVNVGDRQKGRLRGDNVIDVAPEPRAIADGLRRALTKEFRAHAQAGEKPFGDGKSAPRIVAILRGWTPPNPPVKRMVRA